MSPDAEAMRHGREHEGPGSVRVRPLGVLAALLFALALAAGCAKHAVPPPAPAAELWQAFEARRAEAARGLAGLKATASLHYSDPQRKNRVTLSLWGDPRLPLRLDLSAGFGSTFAMIREARGGWSGYLPERRTLYTSDSAQHGQAALGLDLPFSLKELAGVAAGTYAGLAPKDFETAEPAADGGWTYTFSGASVTSMTLDEAGRPVVFAGRSSGGDWTMALSQHGEDAPAAPGKIAIQSGGEASAVLRVKTLERQADPWPAAALALTPPPGTAVTRLDP